jgi:1-deoxy-D-xylulose-5-phosphate reductoisomerase
MQNLAILGATGSVGLNTLDVVAQHPQRYQVVALAANRNVDTLYQQCLQFKPKYAVLYTEAAATQLRQRLQHAKLATTVLSGETGLQHIAQLAEVDTVVAAIVGGAGLLSTLSAAQHGKRILLANKEALVMAGALLMQACRDSGAELIPVDSEHNALLQCLPQDYQCGSTPPQVKRLILTASGGPFLDLPLQTFTQITPAQACAHPKWSMGKKISVDCATMMNKGLEVIEAYWLFALAETKIEVVIHPQSTVHSLVEYVDGSMLAQLGEPDMRIPISYALSRPERIDNQSKRLNLLELRRLDFLPVEAARFPCLDLAYQALSLGGAASIVLNAANEIAVQAFLDERIGFLDIAWLNQRALLDYQQAPCEVHSLDEVIKIDSKVREQTVLRAKKRHSQRQTLGVEGRS